MSDPILSPSEKKRLEQDEKTVMAMAAVFCRGHHHICAQGEKLCPECAKVIDYSLERTRRCPHKHSGTCDTCPTQCYRPAMQQKIKEIMAYSGPRMIFRHPLMAIQHVYRKRKNLKESHEHYR